MLAIKELSTLIDDFLAKNENVSINALAMRMGIAETTLRRIRNGDLVRLPKNDNLLKIICYIYKSFDLQEITKHLPPALKEFFMAEYLIVTGSEKNPVTILDREIVDSQITYLVLKLASNHSGVARTEILRMFGELGLKSAKHLQNSDILLEDSTGIFRTKICAFRLNDESFITNFKTVSEYIKIDREERVGPNLYYNLSESLSLEGLIKVHNIQKKAINEICEIMNDEKFKGELPVFTLAAIDTLQ